MRPLVIFYIFVIYILLQFCWWTWLLVDLNLEIYEQRMDAVALKHADPEAQQRESETFRRDLNKRWMMVAGEGAVFFTLLLIGINQTRKAFKKDFLLARQQKNFLLSITHEFKSPLSAIKLNLQTMRKRDLDRHVHQGMVDQSLRETDRIQTLIENALTATQLENRSLELGRVEFNLSELVREIVDSKTGQAYHRHPVSGNLDEGVYFEGDPDAIHSVVVNLVENAAKYAPDGTTIVIALREREKHIVLRVMDEGPGIPASEREHIFEKFYRVGNEETRRTRGTGLGLYIVKTVVELHNGKVFIKPNKPVGTIFEIIFKKR